MGISTSRDIGDNVSSILNQGNTFDITDDNINVELRSRAHQDNYSDMH